MVGAMRRIEIAHDSEQHRQTDTKGRIRRSNASPSFLIACLSLSRFDTFSLIRYFKADVETNDSGRDEKQGSLRDIDPHGKQRGEARRGEARQPLSNHISEGSRGR
jgi:hypothetical protein